MADKTTIEWTDATCNAINGCSVLSPGCKHCYAMKQAHRVAFRRDLVEKTAGGMVWNGQVYLHEPALLQPLHWSRPRRIFWNAHGDIGHEAVPDSWIARCFAIAALTPQHDHQFLTKRMDRVCAWLNRSAAWADVLDAASRIEGASREQMIRAHTAPWPLPNVWIGTSVEDQKRAAERIPYLLTTPAAVRFLSCEPLLEQLNLTRISTLRFRGAEVLNALTGKLKGIFGDYCPTRLPKLDWVIAGGESGPGARPMHPDWARSLRDQCAAAGVAFHFKQWGEFLPAGQRDKITFQADADGRQVDLAMMLQGAKAEPLDGLWTYRVGKKVAGRLLDGVEHNGMPS